jgi:SAM-dependent methyltransferase
MPFWLDIGSGIDAEHWAATAAPPGVRLVAMDPLLTSGMIQSGRLQALPERILRVGGEVRPPGSVEAGKERSFLPFRSGAFQRVHCGFVLHLYLECLDLLAEEAHRVLEPGGELTVLLPHLGDLRSEQLIQRTEEVLRHTFGAAELSRFEGPFHTFWADLYRDRSYRLMSRKATSSRWRQRS